MSKFEKIMNSQAEALGFSNWGATTLAPALSFKQYEDWVQKKYHGDMKYLETHLPVKENPQSHFPLAKSSLVLTYPYFPVNASEFPLKQARVAAYAQDVDYHFSIKEKLNQLIETLREIEPKAFFLPCVDSSPLLERDLAVRAGLGWFGKNNCVINRKTGSLFFICEILTDLEFQVQAEPVQDFCGTCQKCMAACPTQAIEKPRLLNAKKCISYWTIESRQIPPENLRSQFGDWLFGCDLCQTVCPWNQKIFKAQLEIRPLINLNSQQHQQLVSELSLLLNSSGKKIQKMFFGTPLSRAGSFGLKRNALIVIANRKMIELKSEVENLLDDEKLKDLAKWTLQKLHS